MALRQYEIVAWIYMPVVHNCHDVVVFMGDVCLDLFGDNFLQNMQSAMAWFPYLSR